MKVLCDVHIPLKLVVFLEKNNVEAHHVNNILNSFYTTDHDIAGYADAHNLVVITKDIDFRNSYFLKKSPLRLIRICIGNMATSDLISIFNLHLAFLKQTYASSDSFYVEVSRENALVINS